MGKIKDEDEKDLNDNQAAAGAVCRAANESMILEMPLKIRLIPIRVPITQTELEGQRRQMRTPRISVMTPSRSTQPACAAPRSLK